ncbi:MAG: hypothetical protein EOM15_07525 [Spirochaetia bacterium]|nr:hypothetical protein [Spirochaetia bacterium]
MVRHATYLQKNGISYKISRTFSFLCAIFLIFLVWGMSMNLREGVPFSSMIHIFVLMLFTLFGALYKDSWVFDTTEKTITNIYGFGPFCKKSRFDFAEVERLELNHFVKGKIDKDATASKRRFRSMIVFSLRLTEDRVKDIEIIAEKVSAGRVEAAFNRIGLVTGLSLFMDRPRDMDLHISYKDSLWQ